MLTKEEVQTKPNKTKHYIVFMHV